MKKRVALILAIYAGIVVLLSEYLLDDNIRLFVVIPVLIVGILIINQFLKPR
ncbi:MULTISPECIES: hypothetical protein [Bacillus]|uniref:Uncharacterized protein n=1 Tax=Bacillus capparidis TaxID=1840411 RepID=A0ABS4CZY9_9BACI|nr:MULTISPECIES: hypothetical protein [Bacillus]MBP1082950.1 hypothetical protein [Bacillus capparidis]MED1098071.1 hypothetical protein [Bacillus capparidis]